MIPKAMDSLDLVEAVMLIEEVFGTEIPDGDAETFGSPREMVIGLNFTFQTNGPARGLLLFSKDWPKLTTILNWLKAWRAHGVENKSLLSSVRCSTSRALECNRLIVPRSYQVPTVQGFSLSLIFPVEK